MKRRAGRNQVLASKLYSFLSSNQECGFTRRELAAVLKIRQDNFYSAMKLAREMAEKDGFAIPTASPEVGHTYRVTDLAEWALTAAEYHDKQIGGLVRTRNKYSAFAKQRQGVSPAETVLRQRRSDERGRIMNKAEKRVSADLVDSTH